MWFQGREAPSSSNEFESGGISSDAYIGDDAADAKHQGGNERVEHGRCDMCLISHALFRAPSFSSILSGDNGYKANFA